MNCNEALILMDLVLDGEAAQEEEQLLQFHVKGCDSCRRSFQLNMSISKRVKELEEPVPDSYMMDMIRQRLLSGNYNQSSLPGSKGSRYPVWRIAAVVPFAAALLLFIHNVNGGHSRNYGARAAKDAAVQSTAVHYTPAPVVAYSRSSSVTTF
jgi:predicted anti-sigma-YlaC factor YlaD